MERSWDCLWIHKQVLDCLRHIMGIDTVETELPFDGSKMLGDDGESCAGKLRSLARNGSIDCHHNTTVSLLEVHIQRVAYNEETIAILVAE